MESIDLIRGVFRKDLDSMGWISTGIGIGLATQGNPSLLYSLMCEAIFVRLYNNRDREDIEGYTKYLTDSLGAKEEMGSRFIRTSLRVHNVLSECKGDHNQAYRELMKDKGADSETVKAVIVACVKTAKEFKVSWDKKFDNLFSNNDDNDERINGAIGIVSAFLMIAGADGDIDKKEINSFGKSLAQYSNNAKVGDIFALAAGTTMEISEALLETGVDLEKMSSAIVAGCKSIKEERGPDSLKHYKIAIREMVEGIASASGGFLGFGRKIGEEESAAIKHIEAILATVK